MPRAKKNKLKRGFLTIDFVPGVTDSFAGLRLIMEDKKDSILFVGNSPLESLVEFLNWYESVDLKTIRITTSPIFDYYVESENPDEEFCDYIFGVLSDLDLWPDRMPCGNGCENDCCERIWEIENREIKEILRLKELKRLKELEDKGLESKKESLKNKEIEVKD